MSTIGLDPRPAIAPDDFPDVLATDTKVFRNVLLPLALPAALDFGNLIRRQAGHSMPLPAGSRAVAELVGHVFGLGRPPEMPGIDAALVALAAGVSGLMFRRRGLAMGDNAHGSRCGRSRAVKGEVAVTPMVQRKREAQASVARVVGIVSQPLGLSAILCLASAGLSGRSRCRPALIVHCTHSPGERTPIAAGNETTGGDVNHSRSPWLAGGP